MKHLLIRQVGGTRGCGRGHNFGKVGDPQPNQITLPVGGTHTTTVVHRRGSLLLYAVEWFVADLHYADLKYLADSNQKWDIYPIDQVQQDKVGDWEASATNNIGHSKGWCIPGAYANYYKPGTRTVSTRYGPGNYAAFQHLAPSAGKQF